MEVGLVINEKKTKYLKCTKKYIRTENLNINNLHVEQVQQYKYLGSIINDSNSIEEEIKERTALGIKAYYANQKFFKSRLVTKYLKLKLYRTVIRPIVTHASETFRVLKGTIIQKLLVFERKILRRIFGLTKENQICRIKTNEELDKLIKQKNLVNCITAQRISWFGHVQGMSDTRTVKKIFKWKPLTKDHKENPSTNGRITSNRIFAK